MVVAISRMITCGTTWNRDTSIEATGNISRGTAIFCTSDLLRTIDRVPAFIVSTKKWTMIRPQKTWMAKSSVRWARPKRTPITK